ncbi:hypothetical protein CQW23_04120 [Capsicum baccatum]|uniref:NB-ARC domain-containing protein n=1 Tax=Capsicum baccatum TaxID=33114 RepID=A0A2G2XDR4_CAPBA|nr:hypothetical protein CQW23_04120 [Capsicum baccatum]
MLPTTVELSSKSMVVIEEEEQVLMDKVLGGTDQLGAIAIVGMSGLGKTTLAKKLYHHENLVNRFDVRSWCTCVSQVHDKKKILLELLGYEFKRHVEIERSEDEFTYLLRRHKVGIHLPSITFPSHEINKSDSTLSMPNFDFGASRREYLCFFVFQYLQHHE